MTDLEGAPASAVDDDATVGFSPLAMVGVGTVGILGLAWFLVSWLVLGSPLTDAIGETVGSLAAILLIVSIIGAARSSTR
ncbi:hypothetical protein Daura_49205 [Dactylosporangium aurantiacum]|uniref:Uncharacterized protein n=1 Tax=Dactylosporangium aurantiacum TaxID=35754 RepID=A0A9Q9IHP3_9ACTN|nr:hypothetical protein [Dactylosporangium aurantiacum]MDG6107565.1 hypothetical protein [Dactylosporangium aurantiacum]UWZ54350.1 hypothetical protein Daura_49205 [Dactylosporangium aurantiacum]